MDYDFNIDFDKDIYVDVDFNLTFNSDVNYDTDVNVDIDIDSNLDIEGNVARLTFDVEAVSLLGDGTDDTYGATLAEADVFALTAPGFSAVGGILLAVTEG